MRVVWGVQAKLLEISLPLGASCKVKGSWITFIENYYFLIKIKS